MLDHNEIHQRLAGIFPPSPGPEAPDGIVEIARLYDPGLGREQAGVHVFIPDIHLLSDEDTPLYPRYHFTQGAELERFLEALLSIKIEYGGELVVRQLGDLYDVWRAPGGRGDSWESDEIALDNAAIVTLLTNQLPAGVGAEVFAGNHDYCLKALRNHPRFRIVPGATGDGSDILVLHGDVFSWAERIFPDNLQAALVRLARWVEAGAHTLDAGDQEIVKAANLDLERRDTRIGAGPVDLDITDRYRAGGIDMANVVRGDFDRRNLRIKKHYEPARALALELCEQGHDVRVVVMGHSHWPRLVTGDRGDGVPFVLMDCGAWFGTCRLTSNHPWLHSAHIGVMAGNDLRLYQLGWREA